jgi:hypothetical protein
MPTKESEAHREAEYMKSVAKELISESVGTTPGRLSEINVELNSVKAYFSELLDLLLIDKAAKLEAWRVETGSVAGAKSKWNATPEGRNEIIIRGIIARIKDQSSVIKQRINVKRDEAFGSY